MALTLQIVRFGNVTNPSIKRSLKWIPAIVAGTQTRQLHSVKLKGESYERLYKPWDYKNKPYIFYHMLWEHTTKRFDENTKIIIVEGNIGTDKVSVGKKIAEEFDMLFLPDISENAIFINDHGKDLRELNKWLPKHDRFVDLKALYSAKDPKEVLRFGLTQCEMFQKRTFNYVLAVRHLLNTGQGVVVERSPWSDRCFADALAKCGYFTRKGKEYYNNIYDRVTEFLWKPHLTIYIDQSVKECKELIAKRNNPIEKDSPLLTDKYLQGIEDSYKNKVLPFLQKHGELLTFDVDDLSNMDEILYDMQKLDLEPPVRMDPVKFDDWYETKEWNWNVMRMMVNDDSHLKQKLFLTADPTFMVEEFDLEDPDKFETVVTLNEDTHQEYEPGFVPGKDNYLFKTSGLYFEKLH